MVRNLGEYLQGKLVHSFQLLCLLIYRLELRYVCQSVDTVYSQWNACERTQAHATANLLLYRLWSCLLCLITHEGAESCPHVELFRDDSSLTNFETVLAR